MGYLNTIIPFLLVSQALGAFQHVPSLPASRREQYSLQKPDGAFVFGYDTGDGSYHKAEGAAGGAVKGSYGYQDPTGYAVQLEYTADEGGFQPKGNHLPTPPPIPAEFAALAPYSSDPYSAPSSFQDPLADPNADASYNFAFDTPTYNRQESSDPNGNVQGSYSYVDKEGKSHSLTFMSGAEKGFVAESADIPKMDPNGAVAAPGPYSSVGAGPAGSLRFMSPSTSYNFDTAAGGAPSFRNYPNGGSGTLMSSFSSPAASYNINAGPSSGSTSVKANFPAVYSYSFDTPGGVPDGPGSAPSPYSAAPYSAPYSAPGRTQDGSYDFSFDTTSYNRKEMSDPSGNVKGSYSYVGLDGQTHTIDYKAGSATGYVAEGADIPKAPPAPDVPAYAPGPAPYSSGGPGPYGGSAGVPIAGAQKFLPVSTNHKYGYIFT